MPWVISRVQPVLQVVQRKQSILNPLLLFFFISYRFVCVASIKIRNALVLKFIREGTVEIYAVANLIMFSNPSISYAKKNWCRIAVTDTRHCIVPVLRFTLSFGDASGHRRYRRQITMDLCVCVCVCVLITCAGDKLTPILFIRKQHVCTSNHNRSLL